MRLLTILTVMLGLAATAWTQEAESPVDFDSQVAPILKKHCASCHNDDDAESEFNVSSAAKILEGSSAGAAIVAGNQTDAWV